MQELPAFPEVVVEFAAKACAITRTQQTQNVRLCSDPGQDRGLAQALETMAISGRKILSGGNRFE